MELCKKNGSEDRFVAKFLRDLYDKDAFEWELCSKIDVEGRFSAKFPAVSGAMTRNERELCRNIGVEGRFVAKFPRASKDKDGKVSEHQRCPLAGKPWICSVVYWLKVCVAKDGM